MRSGLFAEQMATLAEEGCVSFSMSEVARRLKAGSPFPRGAVALTFDDAFANVAEVAGPIMARYGFTATVYVITGMVGRVTNWTAHGAGLPRQAIADWSQLESLQQFGVEIGAHTASHGFLTAYSDAELQRELRQPRVLLQEQLGVPVNSFAYPQGDYDSRVVAAVRRAGYTSAVTIDQGRASRGDDLFRLPRLHVGNNATPDVIRAFVVPTISPTYKLVNLLMHRVLRKSTWPRPSAQQIQSTQSVPRGTLSRRSDACDTHGGREADGRRGRATSFAGAGPAAEWTYRAGNSAVAPT